MLIKPVLIAVQFMTRLPVPQAWLPVTYDDKLMGRSVLAYPLVGLIIGLVLWGVASLINTLPSMLVAALLLMVWVLITGALHLDGLADCADAWVGGQGNRERTLAIMKDKFIGPVGVAVLVSVLLIKFAALAAINTLTLAVLITPVMARAFVILLFLTTPYVRENGIGQQQSMHIPKSSAYILLLLLLCAYLLLLGGNGVVPFLGLVAVFVLLRRKFIKGVGGMTGDIAGAMLEIMEAAILVLFAGIF